MHVHQYMFVFLICICVLNVFIGVIWMFMGLIVGAIFLGAISTAISVTYSSTDTIASWSDYAKLCDRADSDTCIVCTYISVAEDIAVVKSMNGMNVEIVVAEDFGTCASMMESGEVTLIFMDNAIVSKGIESFEHLDEEATISPPFYNIDNSLIFPDLWNIQEENATHCLDANNTLIVQVNNAMLEMKDKNRVVREAYIVSYFGSSVLSGSDIKSSSNTSHTSLNYWVISPPFVLMCIYALTILARDMRRARKTLSAISVTDRPAVLDVVKQIIQKNKLLREEEALVKEEQASTSTASVRSLSKLNDRFERRFKSMDRKLNVLLEALGKGDAIGDAIGGIGDSFTSQGSSTPPIWSPFSSPSKPTRRALRRRSVSLGQIDAKASSTRSFDKSPMELTSILPPLSLSMSALSITTEDAGTEVKTSQPPKEKAPMLRKSETLDLEADTTIADDIE